MSPLADQRCAKFIQVYWSSSSLRQRTDEKLLASMCNEIQKRDWVLRSWVKELIELGKQLWLWLQKPTELVFAHSMLSVWWDSFLRMDPPFWFANWHDRECKVWTIMLHSVSETGNFGKIDDRECKVWSTMLHSVSENGDFGKIEDCEIVTTAVCLCQEICQVPHSALYHSIIRRWANKSQSLTYLFDCHQLATDSVET